MTGEKRRFIRRRVVPSLGALCVLSLAFSAAFLTSGFSPVESESSVSQVWITRGGSATSAGGEFARVNLSAGELDSFSSVESSSEVSVWQMDTFTLGVSGARIFAVDESAPAFDVDGGEITDDLSRDTGAAITAVSAYAGTAVFVDTSEGTAYAASSENWTALSGSFAPIDVSGAVLAAAVSVDGRIYLLEKSGDGMRVETYSRETSELDEVGTIAATASDNARYAIATTGQDWFVLETGNDAVTGYSSSAPDGVVLDSSLFGEDLDAVSLQQGSVASARVLAVSSNALVSIPVDDPAQAQLVEVEGISAAVSAASPAVTAEGCVAAAWVNDGASTGTAMTVCGDEDPSVYSLSAPSGATDSADTPVLALRGSGEELIVNDVVSGHAWMLEGEPIESSWTWNNPDDSVEREQETSQDEQRAEYPMAPVANDDTYSVRAGSTSTIPVLLNDTDANGDPFVLVSTGESAPTLDSGPDNMTVSVVNDNQQLSVTVPAGVEVGNARLSYTLTDGTSSSGDGGLYSNRASVMLNIIDSDENTAPTRVLAGSSVISVAAGGTATVNVLQCWADAELDPLVISSAEFTDSASASDAAVVVQADGSIVFRHLGTSNTGPFDVEYTVEDGHGGTATDVISFQITGQLSATNFAVTTSAGTATTIDLSMWVYGASSEATVNVTGVDGVTFRDGLFGFVFTPSEAGTYVIPYTVVDGSSASGRVLVSVSEADAALSVAPLTVKLRADEYQTVSIADALSGVGTDVALVNAVSVQQKKVDVTVLDFSRIRMITNDSLGADDVGTVIDTITYTVVAGERTAVGVISVYLQAKNTSTSAPVVVNDTVAVVSGAQVDIPVLDNDRDSNGGALSLNAGWTSEDTDGAGGSAWPRENGVYFPSGNVIRYLAPEVSDTTVVSFSYDVIGSNGQHAEGTVTVTIVPADKVTAGSAPTLTARTVSRGTVEISAPTSLGSVQQSLYFVATSGLDDASSGVATIGSDRTTISYVAPLVSASTTISFSYTVQNSSGEQFTGTVQVGVSSVAGNLDPVALTDFVTVTSGQQARVDPIANDIATDAADELTLGEIELPDGSLAYAYEVGSVDDPFAQTSDRRDPTVDISVSEDSDRTLVITPLDSASTQTVTLGYRVVETGGLESYGRIIVSYVDGDVNLYPVVADTTVTSRDYADDDTFTVDVVSGKVSWANGDAASLSVAAVQADSSISISGHTVSGTRPDSTVRIPMSFTGTTTDGTSVVGYAFLIIVGSTDEVPTVTSTQAVSVNAGESHTFDITTDVSAPRGSSISIARVTGETIEGTVTQDSDTTLTYTANDDGGGSDSVIFVLSYTMKGTTSEVTLAFPVFVVAQSPEVNVTKGTSGELAPGESLSLSFMGLVSPWTGTVEQKQELTYTITAEDPSSASAQLTAIGEGSSLTNSWMVTAAESAKVGTVLRFSLVVSSADKSSTPVTVEVTIVGTNRDLPVPAQCTASIDLTGSAAITRTFGVANGASGGSSCSGGFNPFSSDLTVVDASASSSAAGLAVTAQGGDIVVNIPNPESTDIPSMVTVQYRVEDVQGRVSSTAEMGVLTITFNARPQAPTLSVSSYDYSSVTFHITPNAIGGSPEEYVVESKSGSGSWQTAGTIQGSGQKSFTYSTFGGAGTSVARDFRVYAQNSVDRSSDSEVISSVYPQAQPSAPASLAWTAGEGKVTVQIGTAGTSAEQWVIEGTGVSTQTVANSTSGASVAVTLDVSDSTVVTVTGKTEPCTACRAATGPAYDAGSQSVTAIPYGTPVISDLLVTRAENSSTVTITATVDMNSPYAQAADYAGTAPNWAFTCTKQRSGSSSSLSCGGPSSSADGQNVTLSWTTDAVRGNGVYAIAVSNGVSQATASGSALRWPTQNEVDNALSYTIEAIQDGKAYVPKVTGELTDYDGVQFKWGNSEQSSGDAWVNATTLDAGLFSSSTVQVRFTAGGETSSWYTLSPPTSGYTQPLLYEGHVSWPWDSASGDPASLCSAVDGSTVSVPVQHALRTANTQTTVSTTLTGVVTLAVSETGGEDPAETDPTESPGTTEQSEVTAVTVDTSETTVTFAYSVGGSTYTYSPQVSGQTWSFSCTG